MLNRNESILSKIRFFYVIVYVWLTFGFVELPFFLIVMLSGIYTPIYWLWKFSMYRSYSSFASGLSTG